MKQFIIIGGGSGGLAMANCLQLQGLDFELYEQASSPLLVSLQLPLP